jgi:hypothetical protein
MVNMNTCLDCKDSGKRGCDVKNSKRKYTICSDFKPKKGVI